LTFHGLFSGGPQNNPITLGARLSQLGYGFFVLVTIASCEFLQAAAIRAVCGANASSFPRYTNSSSCSDTANLATILVASSQSLGINSIDDAVAAKLDICVLSALLPELKVQTPALHARWQGSPDISRCVLEGAKSPGKFCGI